MNKIILSLVITIITTLYVNAQTEKGNWLIGGSAGYSSTSNSQTGGYKSTLISFQLMPVIGTFVKDNLAVGIGIGYLSQTEKYGMPNSYLSFSDTTTTVTFAFAPFIRYYFLPLGTNTKLFVNGSFGVGNANQKETAITSQSLSTTAWQIAAGPTFFLNKSTALEIALAYGSTSYKETGTTSTANIFEIEVGFQIYIQSNHKKY